MTPDSLLKERQATEPTLTLGHNATPVLKYTDSVFPTELHLNYTRTWSFGSF